MKNGNTTMHVRRKNEPLVHVVIHVPIFPTYSTKDDATLAVYAELLTSGAGTYSREAFTDALLNLGTTLRVESAEGKLEILVTGTEQELKKTLALLTLMLTNPRFESQELLRIKKHAKNMLPLLLEDAKNRAYDAFISRIMHPQDVRYEVTPDILMKAVSKVQMREVRKMHALRTSRIFTVTVGGSEKSVKEVEKAIKKIAGTDTTPEVYFENQEVERREIMLIDIPHKQNIEFTLGCPLPLLPESAEYAAFVFGMNVLALQGGFAGRLMSTVREKEGLTYSIYGKIEGVSKNQIGFWRIMTFFNPKDAVKGITSTLREIKTMREKGITKNELSRFKAIMKTRRALKYDSLTAQVGELHGLKLMGLTPSDYEAFIKRIEKLTIDDVNAVMKKYLDPEKIIISGAGPVAKIERDLKKFAK